MYITIFTSNETAMSNQPASVLCLLTDVNMAREENKMLKTLAAVFHIWYGFGCNIYVAGNLVV